MSRAPFGMPYFQRAFVALPLAVAVAVASTAHAGPAQDAPPRGAVVFARDGALWAVPATGGDARQVADLGLPADEAIGAVRVSPAGNLAVVESASGVRWVELDVAAVRRAARAPCAGPVQLAPDGSAFLCAGERGTVYQPTTWRHRVVAVDPSAAAPIGDGVVLFEDGGQLWRAPAVRPTDRVRVADHAPVAHLLPSPGGDRAVGFYSDGGAGEHVYAFRIDDGRATRRTLAGPAMPAGWSADGEWVLLRDTRRRACVVRSRGGQRLCWNGFTGLALSSDGNHVLLTRANDQGPATAEESIYVAPIRGTSAKRPAPLVTNTWPAAAWWSP